MSPPQALTSIKAEHGQANDGLSSALLVIFLDSARNLPVSRPSMQLCCELVYEVTQRVELV